MGVDAVLDGAAFTAGNLQRECSIVSMYSSICEHDPKKGKLVSEGSRLVVYTAKGEVNTEYRRSSRRRATVS